MTFFMAKNHAVRLFGTDFLQYAYFFCKNLPLGTFINDGTLIQYLRVDELHSLDFFWERKKSALKKRFFERFLKN